MPPRFRGRSNRQGRFDDVMLLVGDQLAQGSVFRLLAEHGVALFGDEYFADLLVVPTPHAVEIVLTADERAELEGWARRRTSAAGLAMRARVVLAAADGGDNTELSERLGLSIGTVRRW